MLRSCYSYQKSYRYTKITFLYLKIRILLINFTNGVLKIDNRNEEEKFLLFLLDDVHYGIPIANVNEIIGIMKITNLPNTPKFIKGVINLRRKIIPLIDLRLKLAMPEKDYDEETCIIIINVIQHNNNKTLVGLVVDKVYEVININKNDIDVPAEYNQNSKDNFISGIGKLKGIITILLNIDSILNNYEIFNLVKENIQ